MFKIRLLIAGIALGAGSIASAQDYFDFGQIPGVPDQAAVQIDLNPTLLGLVSATTRAENPAAADLLSSIDGIRVRLYKTLENIDDVLEFVDDASARLERANWQRIVSVQDDANIRVFVRSDGESITGATAMIVGDKDQFNGRDAVEKVTAAPSIRRTRDQSRTNAGRRVTFDRPGRL